MLTTFKHDSKRPLALRRTIGSFSGGTRVDFVQTNIDNTVMVMCRGDMLDVEPDDLVVLRKRELELPGAELRRRMAAVLGS